MTLPITAYVVLWHLLVSLLPSGRLLSGVSGVAWQAFSLLVMGLHFSIPSPTPSKQQHLQADRRGGGG